jgi:hypothetical protein
MKSRGLRCTGYVARIRGDQECIQKFGKYLFGISRRFEDNSLDHTYIGCGDRRWMEVALERVLWY